MKLRKTISAALAAAMVISCAPLSLAADGQTESAEPKTAVTAGDHELQTMALLPYQDTSLSFEERAADLVARMTLEEKAAQTIAKNTGSHSNAVSRLGVHGYYYWREGIHGVARQGVATSFPSSLAMSNTWDPALMQEAMDITSTEARGKNNRYDLNYWNPTINMARDPRWGRNEESYGEDPYLTAEIGGAAVRGMQGTDDKYLKTITTLKHYAANNNEGERQRGTSIMNERTMREYYGRAFRDIVESSAPGAVMSSYNGTTIYRDGKIITASDGQKIDYIASSANSYLINDLLRRTYGFGGFVVGDCGAWDNAYGVAALKQKLYPDMAVEDITSPMTVSKILQAGSSLDCNSGDAGTDQVANAVREGLVSEDLLDIMVYELFLQRMKTGEFDDGAKYQDITASVLETDEHVAVAEKAAEESWVLLENNGALPLGGSKAASDTPYTITVADFGADGKLDVSYKKRDSAPDKAVLIAASYKNDVIASVDIADVDGSGQQALEVADTGDTKIFVWDGTDTMKPLSITRKVGEIIPDIDEDDEENKPINVAIVGDYAKDVVLGDYSGEPTKIVTPVEGITSALKAVNPDSTIQLIGSVDSSTPLFNIKSITLKRSSGGDLKLDLSTAKNVMGMNKTSDGLMNITTSGMAVIPNVNFANVTDVQIEAASMPGMPNVTVEIGYESLSQNAANVNIAATANADTYTVNTGTYNGATGGYTDTRDMYITIKANADFSVANFKSSLDAADYIIAYGGTTTADSSESHDRSSIDLPVSQSHVQEICDVYPEKTIVVLQTVGQVNVEKFKDKCAALLWTSYNGQKQGEALGKVLTGEVNPSGKLTTTWYPTADLNKMPIGTDRTKVDGIDYNFTSYELAYDINNPTAEYPGRTYQYYNGTPVYPFGYGSSYTTFAYSDIAIDKTAADANDIVTITAKVTNTGAVKGAEVAQLYITVPGADGKTLPLKQLKGFTRVELNPGETKTVSFKLDISDVFFFDEANQQNYVVNGTYTAKVGGSSDDANAQTITFDVSGNIAEDVKSVYAIPSGIKLYSVNSGANPANTIDAGASVTLKNDKVVTDFANSGITVTYTSSDTDVAKVDENGIVTAGTKEGTATITVTAAKGGSSATVSFPVVSQYRDGISADVKANYLAQLDSAYAACPAIAYTSENYAELEKIYTETRALVEAALIDDGLELIVKDAIAAMLAIPKLSLNEEYTIKSVNPEIIKDGRIEYSENGIGVINASETAISGTITENNPAVIDLQAMSGESVVTNDLVWTVERLDGSSRKNPDIDIKTGKLTLYENGVYRITANDYPNNKYGAITVYANLQIEGESADDGNGAKLDDVKSGASNNGLNAGSTGTSWMRFDGVKLERLTDITFRVSKNSGDSVINVSLLPDSDWIIASTTVSATGAWTNWTEAKATINRNELGRLTLDENGCGTIYVQTNSANLDYMTLNYNYNVIDAYNRANGKITANVNMNSGTLTATVNGTQKSSVTITGSGAYTLDGFANGDNVTITAADGANTSTASITYSVPAPREIYVYNFSDSIYDSFFTASEGTTLTSTLGMQCIGGWSSDKGKTYKHDNGVTYTFTRGLKGGNGTATARRVFFTPDYDGVVSAVFAANTERVMNIEQGQNKVTKAGIGDSTATVVQLNVTAGTPVYVYGGGSNKTLYGVLFEPNKSAVEATPTPEPTPTPTPAPVPDTDFETTIEFESFTKSWKSNGSAAGKAEDLSGAGGNKIIGSTADNDVFYFGNRSMDNLLVITLYGATRNDAGNSSAEFFAADTTGISIDSASRSQIDALLTADNSLGKVDIIQGKDWKAYNELNVVVNQIATGEKGLFVKFSSDGKYAGNHDWIKLKYNFSGTSANALTAANENGTITINGSIVTITDNDGAVTTVDYSEQSGKDVTFKKVIDWDGSFTALAYNSKSDKTEIIGGTSLNIWADQTPVSYSEKDEDAPDKPVINDICAVGDQLYAVCDGGYMITMTPCAKCSSIRKICDFDIERVEADGDTLQLIGSDDMAEISIIDARQTNIKGEAAASLIAGGAIAVDVRTAEEYAEDSLDGSINVPVDEFEGWISEQDADTTIIVYCKSGKRAAQATEIAAKQGFINIYNAGSIDNLK